MKTKNIIKSVLALMVVAVLVFVAWAWYATKTSNPWHAATTGDIPTPLGYTRVEAPKGSYTDYLRSLPLKRTGSKVKLYTGGNARLQFLSVGVIDMPILSNSEQCADVTMHLRAEYLFRQGRYSEICFRDVNGKMQRYHGGASRKAFESYLRKIYGVCSTFSVYHETAPRKVSEVKPGDVLVFPARNGHKYGHAILVIDVAHDKNGHVAVMCAEGNTPAREMHVVRNPNPLNKAWFMLDEDDDWFLISCFKFNSNELRHY